MPPPAYDCYVINLRREPHKYEAVSSRLAAAGFAHTRFDAVDGSLCSQDDLLQQGILRAGTTRYTAGAIGCAMSHLALWRRAIESDRNVLVFEDDVFVRSDAASQLERLLGELAQQFDIFLLGCNTSSVLDVKLSSVCNLESNFSNLQPTRNQLKRFSTEAEPTIALRLNNAFGTCAYVVSPAGAAKLSALFPMDNRPVVIPSAQRMFGATSFSCITIDMLASLRRSRAVARSESGR